MKKIVINSDNRRFNISSIVVGYLDENKTEKIEFIIPDKYKEFGKKACFNANGQKFAKIFDDINGSILTFTRDITKYKELEMSIEFFKIENEDEIIARTSKLQIIIENTVICDDISPDEPKIIILDKLIEEVTKVGLEVEKKGVYAKEQGDYAKSQGDYAKEQVVKANEEANKIINDFETNVGEYTTAFNENATNKTTEYNTNAISKVNEFNTNATTKTEEFNSTATNFINNIGHKTITPNNLINFSGYDLAERRLSDDVPYDASGRIITPASQNYVYNRSSASSRAIKTRIPQKSYITITKEVSDRFRVCLYKKEPPFGGLPDKVICDDNTLTNISFNTEEYNWLVAFYTISNENPNIKVIVENALDYNSLLRENNLDIFDKVKCTNLFDKDLILKGYWLGNVDENYQFFQDANRIGFRSYIFPLIKDETYTIDKTLTNKFRVALFADFPEKYKSLDNYFKTLPQKVIIDDETQTTCEFNSENYRYCVVTYTINSEDVDMTITNSSNIKYVLKKEFIKDYIPSNSEIIKTNGGYVFEDDNNSSNEIWSSWNSRLSFGMNTGTAPVPVRVKSQLLIDGTCIVRNQGNQNFNRWGFHVYEAYGKNNYDRITMLMNKHDDEISKKVAELYYYTGDSHFATSYAWFRLGSDVKYHSFMFDRDTMVAFGNIDLKNTFTLARISPTNDLITTYNTVAEADNAYEPESSPINNLKCLKYIALKNAENGTMFYDTDRNKVVVKVNGSWCDMNVTPVENGTYNF